MSYHVDRFFAAVSVLAGHGHIKQRRTRAYEEHLAAVGEDELPIALKQAFSDLRHSMSRVAPHNGEGRICASVRKMSIDEASACAASVVSLYGKVLREAENLQDPLPLNENHENVPAFLVKSAS